MGRNILTKTIIPKITVPRFPLVPPGGSKGRKPERITSESSTDLNFVVDQISSEQLTQFVLNHHRWALVSVLHPYTPDLQVMLIDVERTRYIPGPEWITDEEGNKIFQVAASALDFMTQSRRADTCSVGFNYSPRAWGRNLEEKGGVQTVSTKFHPMIWINPPLPEPGKFSVFNDSTIEWVPAEILDTQSRRLLLENDYGVVFGQVITATIKQAFALRRRASAARFGGLLDFGKWYSDARGAVAPFRDSVFALLREEPRFFSVVIKPIANALSGLMRRLTEAMTTMDCGAMDEILRKTEQGPLAPKDLENLRSVPRVRSVNEIDRTFETEGWPKALLSALLPAVRARCEIGPESDPSVMWRKGFGYSLVFSGLREGPGYMRILPSVYLGAGGVVEAQGMILARIPQDAPLAELRRRSHELCALGSRLASVFT